MILVTGGAGNIASCFADASVAKEELGWEATKSLEEIFESSWKWQNNNPDGYK